MRRRRQVLKRSFGAVVLEYRASAEFKRLAPNTRLVYNRALKTLEDLYDLPIEDLKRRHVIGLRDAFHDRPALANQLVSMFSVVMRYAVEMEYRETNPAYKIRPLPVGSHSRWNDEAIAFALKVMPERFRRAIVLALYTGQREGDVLKMRWSDYDGEGISVVQEKTKAKLWIPCHAELKAHLEAWKRERVAVTILTDSHGRPYRASSFSTGFWVEAKKHIELKGLVFHGLRMTAAAKLAEAGCSTHEIAAITGHRTLGMLMHYTREAEQKTRARAAITKLETAASKTRPQVIERKRDG